jgi:hypothetical protein
MSATYTREWERYSTRAWNNGDIVRNVVSYFNGIHDLVHCGGVNTFVGKICQHPSVLQIMMHRNLHRRLSLFNLQKNEFDDMLRSTKSIIAGSCPLHCITGDDSSISGGYDIDVYLHENQKTLVVQFFVENGYWNVVDNATFFPDTIFNLFDRLLNPVPSEILNTETMTRFIAKDNIHLITVEGGWDPVDATANYAKNLMKNYYNGVKFTIRHPGHILKRQWLYYNSVRTTSIVPLHCLLLFYAM